MNFEVKEVAQLVYELNMDFPSCGYKIDNSSLVSKGSFHRVAYYVQLQHPVYGNQWVYTAFDSFTCDIEKTGIPKKSGIEGVFSVPINNLVVKSSSSELVHNCSNQGHLLFTAYNYGDMNGINECKGEYGTMQISSNDNIIWAYNHIDSEISDIGIGPNVHKNKVGLDWTFAENSTEYTIKLMKIYCMYNEVGHNNEVSLNDNKMLINMKGVSHGDSLIYNTKTQSWGVPQIPYLNKGTEKLPNFIIALSGQSNSQGWNTETENIWEDQPHQRIFGFNAVTEQWEIADMNTQSLGSSWHKSPGWQSFAFHFAKRLVEGYSEIRPGIINIGIGAQQIARWCKLDEDHKWYKLNATKALSTGVLPGDIFDVHVNLINKALAQLEQPKVDVILFHQGESNADDSEDYYSECFRHVVKQYREIPYCNKDTPFIVGETTVESVNKQLKDICATETNMKYVYTEDLTRQHDDPIHFDTIAQRNLGTRYFKSYRELFI
jgi:hypothetical protein